MDPAALAKFNQQFQRSVTSPLNEVQQTPRLELDGAAVLSKYVGHSADAGQMSGAEFYAMVATIKRQQGAKGEALENELMKIPRQKDKKLRLAEWISQHLAESAPPMPAAGLASPAPQPAMPRLDLGGAMEESVAPAAVARPATARAHHSALGGGQMSELLGAPSPRAHAPPLTARPATAADGQPTNVASAAAPADMSVTLAAYCSGRDHQKMTGAEYHALVAWLKANGHDSLEDMLLKVRPSPRRKPRREPGAKLMARSSAHHRATSPAVRPHPTPSLPPGAAAQRQEVPAGQVHEGQVQCAAARGGRGDRTASDDDAAGLDAAGLDAARLDAALGRPRARHDRQCAGA